MSQVSREKIVLAYSGGLDTSVMVKWLQDERSFEVVTLTVDVGMQKDLVAIEEKAYALGAVKHYSVDAKSEFVYDYIFPAIRANALYEEKYPLSSSIARPLIASKLVQIARKEDAVAVAHGCTGKGNDQVRFDITIKTLDPSLKIVAPVREWNMTRDREVEYALRHGIPVAKTSNPYSIDQNLWGRSIECGPIEDPSAEPPDDAFEWTVNATEAPAEPAYVSVGYSEGIPVSLDGKKMDGVALITALNELAGSHGVGRIDHIEDRLVGIKSHEVYECPAAVCLLDAHKDLEKSVLTRHEVTFKHLVDIEWARLAYCGLWVDPLREDLDAFIEATQSRISGEVKLKLYKGGEIVVGRSSPYSLYDLSLATYEAWTSFDQKLAPGFIELWGLQTRVARSIIAKKQKAVGDMRVQTAELKS